MILTCFFLIFIPSTIAYVSMGIKPDMVFADNTDRFDVTSVLEEQRRYDNTEQDYVRNARKSNFDSKMAAFLNILNSRRMNPKTSHRNARKLSTDFAYHDAMMQNTETEADFEENLQKLMRNSQFNRRLLGTVQNLHNGAMPTRRASLPDLESEILMHYAVPITMEVTGHLGIPEQ